MSEACFKIMEGAQKLQSGREQLQELLKGGRLDKPLVFVDAARHWPCMSWATLLLQQQHEQQQQQQQQFLQAPASLLWEELGAIETTFRVHKRSSEGAVVWESSCHYVKASLTEFASWITSGSATATAMTAETNLSRTTMASEGRSEGAERVPTALGEFDPLTHWAYADYKYLSELFADHPQLLSAALFEEDFGFLSHPENCAFWMGSQGAYTPCHQDCYGFNLVVQVAGKKRWTLFPPDQGKHLYPTRIPYEESSVFSEVLVNDPDHKRFPLFRNAEKTELILNPGDVLFVPHHWWHFVETLEPSISLNQWYELAKEDIRERVSEALVRVIVSALKPAGAPAPSSPTAGHQQRSQWLNPTEEVWGLEENLGALRESLEAEGEVAGPSLDSLEEFTTFLVNSLACHSLPGVTDHLISDWKKMGRVRTREGDQDNPPKHFKQSE